MLCIKVIWFVKKSPICWRRLVGEAYFIAFTAIWFHFISLVQLTATSQNSFILWTPECPVSMYCCCHRPHTTNHLSLQKKKMQLNAFNIVNVRSWWWCEYISRAENRYRKTNALCCACRRDFNHFQQVKLHYVFYSHRTKVFAIKNNTIIQKKKISTPPAAKQRLQTKESKIWEKITSLCLQTDGTACVKTIWAYWSWNQAPHWQKNTYSHARTHTHLMYIT